MAFNPLHGFRKHQKVILAAITIMCMFIFVLQFSPGGKGDYFSKITDMLGQSRHRKAATLYGQPVYDFQIEELAQQRESADKFIQFVVAEGQGRVLRKVRKEVLEKYKKEDNIHQFLASVLGERSRVFSPNRDQVQFFNFFLDQYLRRIDPYIQQLKAYQGMIAADDKREEASALNLLCRLLEQDKWILSRTRANSLYFGGSAKDLKSLLDFKIWLHEADRQGIQLTSQSLEDLLNQEALGQLPRPEDVVDLNKFFRRNNNNISADFLLKALTDEYRARMAQAVVLGFEPRQRGEASFLPSPVPPYELWQFFREKRTENNVLLLPIAAGHQDFLVQAENEFEALKDKDKELKELFEKHKDIEELRGSPTPGFQQSPRVTAEWVSARPDSAFYQEEAKKRAAAAREATQLMARIGAGGLCPGAGPSDAASVAVLLAATVGHNLPLEERYKKLMKFHGPALLAPHYELLSYYTGVTQPADVAATLGRVLGAGGTQGNVLAAPVAYLSTGYARNATRFKPILDREIRKRQSVATTVILSGTNPCPIVPATAWSYGAEQGDPIPFEVLEDVLDEQHRADLRKELVETNLNTLSSEISRLGRQHANEVRQYESAQRPEIVAEMFGDLGAALSGGAPLLAPTMYAWKATELDLRQRAALAGGLMLNGAAFQPLTTQLLIDHEKNLNRGRIRTYLERAVALYGLKHGTTEKPGDRFSLAGDKGLQPLQDSFDRIKKSPSHAQQVPKKFDQLLIPPDPRAFRGQMSTYEPKKFPDDDQAWKGDQEPMLYWKTGDYPAYVPSFEEARERVKKRWIFQKARDMAKKEAERVAVETRKLKGDHDRYFKDASKQGSPAFTLDRVASMAKKFEFPPAVMSQHRGPVYQKYDIPEDKIEFSTDDLLKKLLDMKEKGDVIVLNDGPEAIFYVAALTERRDASEDQFFKDYSENPNVLLAPWEQENHTRLDFRNAVIQYLEEKQAGLTIDKTFKEEFDGRRRKDDR